MKCLVGPKIIFLF